MTCVNPRVNPSAPNEAALISKPKLRAEVFSVPVCHHHSVGAPGCKYWSAGRWIADFDGSIGVGSSLAASAPLLLLPKPFTGRIESILFFMSAAFIVVLLCSS